MNRTRVEPDPHHSLRAAYSSFRSSLLSLRENLRGAKSHFALHVMLPALTALMVTAAGISAVIVLSSRETDRVAVDRQEQRVSSVVSQIMATIALDQESVSVWDDAVLNVKIPDNGEWLNGNLVKRMHAHLRHDAAFVLDPSNRPIFAFADGVVVAPSYYHSVEVNIDLLARRMRAMLRNPQPDDVDEGEFSPGVADVTLMAGHPAIVSVKPIVSDTGEIRQKPDDIYLDVAVRYLDGTFLQELSRRYLLDGLRFQRHDSAISEETSFPLRTTSGGIIGHFIWQPYRPGALALARITPALFAVLLMIIGIMTCLLAIVYGRSIKLQRSERNINYNALHDPLTGLANRTLFAERLDALLKSPARSKRTIAILYLDLDRFKQVNDTFGHPAGDELMQQFAGRLSALVREDDMIARMDGDEFTILISDLKQDRDINALCERIVEAVSVPFEIEGNRIFVGVSLGVAFAPEQGTERTELVRKADIALYHAKSAGRGRYAIFGREMDVVIQDRRNIERDLRNAVRDGSQIEVHYQPLYSTSECKITGVEALLRWKHPERGMVSPVIFIPVAEESGLIETLGEWVLHQACSTAGSWPLRTLSVNVSAIELRNPNYAEKVRGILTSTGAKPQMLELEVTESAFTDAAGNCERNLRTLRELGVRIALDDFGTGFSSLERLQQLEVDRIKIDRSFVHGCGRSYKDKAIIRAIVDLAHAKGLKVTAEGVETVEQREYLTEIGCDDLQGFLLSRPIPVKEIKILLGFETERISTQSIVLT